MSITDRDIHNLIRQGLQEKFQQEDINFERNLKLYSNQIVKIRQENIFNDLKNDLLLKRNELQLKLRESQDCLLYTSPSPRD